jgi:hypothetical protein
VELEGGKEEPVTLKLTADRHYTARRMLQSEGDASQAPN